MANPKSMNSILKYVSFVYVGWLVISAGEAFYFTFWMFMMWGFGGYAVILLNMIFLLSVLGTIGLLVGVVRSRSKDELPIFVTLVCSILFPVLNTYFIIDRLRLARSEHRPLSPVDASSAILFVIYSIQIVFCFLKLHRLRSTEVGLCPQ